MSLMKTLILTIGSLGLLCHSLLAGAEESPFNLGRQNYILNCQGCHLPDASGSPGLVPRIKDFVGYFLQVEGGREFIVQVPGSANAPINDQELADVLNWMLHEFSKKEIPQDFAPYSAEEVGRLRQKPLVDVNGSRARLIEKIQRELGIAEDGLGES